MTIEDLKKESEDWGYLAKIAARKVTSRKEFRRIVDEEQRRIARGAGRILGGASVGAALIENPGVVGKTLGSAVGGGLGYGMGYLSARALNGVASAIGGRSTFKEGLTPSQIRARERARLAHGAARAGFLAGGLGGLVAGNGNAKPILAGAALGLMASTTSALALNSLGSYAGGGDIPKGIKGAIKALKSKSTTHKEMAKKAADWGAVARRYAAPALLGAASIGSGAAALNYANKANKSDSARRFYAAKEDAYRGDLPMLDASYAKEMSILDKHTPSAPPHKDVKKLWHSLQEDGRMGLESMRRLHNRQAAISHVNSTYKKGDDLRNKTAGVNPYLLAGTAALAGAGATAAVMGRKRAIEARKRMLGKASDMAYAYDQAQTRYRANRALSNAVFKDARPGEGAKKELTALHRGFNQNYNKRHYTGNAQSTKTAALFTDEQRKEFTRQARGAALLGTAAGAATGALMGRAAGRTGVAEAAIGSLVGLTGGAIGSAIGSRATSLLGKALEDQVAAARQRKAALKRRSAAKKRGAGPLS